MIPTIDLNARLAETSVKDMRLLMQSIFTQNPVLLAKAWKLSDFVIIVKACRADYDGYGVQRPLAMMESLFQLSDEPLE